MSRLPTRGEVEAPRPAWNVRAAWDRILLTSRTCTWQAKVPSQGGAELRLDNPASPLATQHRLAPRRRSNCEGVSVV
eukprot:CAMPEP_0204235634 /NCGR_PEP_ID=MMETSP0361-20130328/91840_1 /ASSEMBLY_ACC=CAM_ASM_000343 /TAXON_ID=268821 /ORGANISM="Scrippsiella Hangoei, Strain SHTV-5" /LENGTH=76 /DNA_ID=CAMNT_0051207157 /DNA_START=68 /DNA_END=295 /DNA_ORIENTATION=+